MTWIISILWAFIGVQQFISLEDIDWSQATFAQRICVSILFMVFGPCIMISNVILSLCDMIGGNDDFRNFKT